MSDTRTERDSMGEMQVPIDALYGASTARAIQNFPIAHRPLPPAVIHAYGHLKAACAQANKDLSLLDPARVDAILAAADEVSQGHHDAHFPVDVYQTGSGTSTNMNVNEVIATLANRRLRNNPRVHPNDHVNLGQSSNDTFPTAMSIAAASAVRLGLMPAVERLHQVLRDLAERYDASLKLGRTHLMDATPIRWGQVFRGYAAQVMRCIHYVDWAAEEPRDTIPIGGTAVGTGLNTHPAFAERVVSILNQRMGCTDERDKRALHLGHDRVAGQSSKDAFVESHGLLKTYAVTLSKLANDIRLLGSGPRGGIGELKLPAVQPGSSIMPGKVNPVICESVIQVCCRVLGNDTTLTTAAFGGVGSTFELNTCMPLIIDTFLESTTLLANATHVFVDNCLAELTVNEARCRELLDRSLMAVTALVPTLGYDVCADLAKQAHDQDKTIRQVVLEHGLIPEAELDALFDFDRMTRPHSS